MSLAAFVDLDEFLENRVITLKYRHPACVICGRDRHQSEWRFMWIHHMTCHECISRREGLRDEDQM